MIKALQTAATGLEAQQNNITRISNDLANANTDGYKRTRTEFQELMYHTVKEPGGALGAGTQSPVGIQVGTGVKVGAAHKIHEPGGARMTYNPYDLMIDGNGFFPVQLPNGQVGYSRGGAFHRDSQGRLQLTNGAQLIPQVIIPSNALNVTINNGGEIKISLPNNGEVVAGQIQLVTFPNVEGLSTDGEGIYKPTLASGAPIQAIPGEDGMGLIQQGAIEGSNVNIANSMVEMISTQRQYEMNAKMLTTAGQMWKDVTDAKP
jgi:flagellar basal-body rod protein FlgG